MVLALCCAVLSGCTPGAPTPLDEEKDPHFLRGRNYISARDFDGAIRSFEEAIRANPNSASAHKELGLLYYENRKDYARAIYHLQRLLELRPEDDLAASLREYIVNCKRSLASEVAQLPASQAMQRKLEELQKVKDENTLLRAQNEQLRAQMIQLQQISEAARRMTPNPTVIHPPTNASSAPPVPAPPLQTPLSATPAPPESETPAPAPARTHTVKAGEFPGTIARQYGISVDKLLSANPGVDPRRMQIGQVLKIPAK